MDGEYKKMWLQQLEEKEKNEEIVDDSPILVEE